MKNIDNQVVDTLILAREKFPGVSSSLDAFVKDLEQTTLKEQDTALIDCDLLAKVYINLIDQKEPTLDFQKNNEKSQFIRNEKILYFKKVIKPNLEELNNHKEFLKKNLKKNYFN